MKIGKPGTGAAHAAYICREGKYRDKPDRELTESGNMPTWAENTSGEFWKAADNYERSNGRPYREIEVALPRELNPEQRALLVRDFAASHLKNHPYTYAIHNPPAALDGGEQPHAHIMFCERKLDGIERDKEQFFKRANPSAPEKGGCAKDREWTKEGKLVEIRREWAFHQNRALENAGRPERVDHRSLEAQGIDQEPERHLGPKLTQSIEAEKLKARRELDKERQEVTREIQTLKAELGPESLEVKKAAGVSDRQVLADQKHQAQLTRQAETRPRTAEELVHALASGAGNLQSSEQRIARQPGEDDATYKKRLDFSQKVINQAKAERRELLAPRARIEAELWPERAELARQAERVERELVEHQARHEKWEAVRQHNGWPEWKDARQDTGVFGKLKNKMYDAIKTPQYREWGEEGQRLADEQLCLNAKREQLKHQREDVEREIVSDRRGGFYTMGRVEKLQYNIAEQDSRYQDLDKAGTVIGTARADLDRIRLERERQQELQRDRNRRPGLER